MADLLQQLLTSPLGRQLTQTLSVPTPPDLRRYERGQPLLHGPALVVAAERGAVRGPLTSLLTAAGVEVLDALPAVTAEPAAGEGREAAAVLLDATGIARSQDLGQLHALLHPVLRRVLPSGRVILFGRPPEDTDDARTRAARRALEGLTRSLGKEARGGTTVQLVHVEAGAEDHLDAAVRFLLSGRSAYVSGQVLRVGPPPGGSIREVDLDRPLADQVALVTGAARGIGAAIARVLSRDGAHVVCLDVPSQGDALQRVANDVGGTTLQLDLTAPDAPERLADHLRDRHGGVDVVVHNAGITRDRTLANMERGWWDAVVAVNLTAPERVDEVLLDGDVLNAGARIVCVSSMAGIAGLKGQTNYAASKAGVIGHVQALAPTLAGRGGSINAVAPGFIETDMTAAMPVVPRELGRRLNSMSQGGLPVDVAEVIGFFASPAAVGCNGSVLRVDGQHVFGA